MTDLLERVRSALRGVVNPRTGTDVSGKAPALSLVVGDKRDPPG